MGKVKQILINRFDGGRAFDPREATVNQFAESLNFDTYQLPSTLVPIRGTEADEGYSGSSTGVKAAKIKSIGVATSGATIYGVGNKTDGTGLKFYTKSITASEWSALTYTGLTPESGSVTPVDSFTLVHEGNSGGTIIWFTCTTGTNRQLGYIQTVTSPTTWSTSALTLATTSVHEPVALIGQDGNAYFGAANKIHRGNKDATVTNDVVVLSVNAVVTSMARYGTYIAVAYKLGNRAFLGLWDYSDTQFTEVIDFGEGYISVVENLDGMLVCVMDKFLSTDVFSLQGNGTGSMQIKAYSGGVIQTLAEIKCKATTTRATNHHKFVKNSILYWYAKIPVNTAGTEFLEGLWTFGRRISSLSYATTLHRQMPFTTGSFAGAGDYQYFFGASDGAVQRTKSADEYGLTSSYETLVFDDNNPMQNKEFLEAKVGFEKLTSGQGIVLKYRKNGDTSWTTLTPIPAVATGDLHSSYPMDGTFRECQFRIESTGGAKVTGLKLIYEEID